MVLYITHSRVTISSYMLAFFVVIMSKILCRVVHVCVDAWSTVTSRIPQGPIVDNIAQLNIQKTPPWSETNICTLNADLSLPLSHVWILYWWWEVREFIKYMSLERIQSLTLGSRDIIHTKKRKKKAMMCIIQGVIKELTLIKREWLS